MSMQIQHPENLPRRQVLQLVGAYLVSPLATSVSASKFPDLYESAKTRMGLRPTLRIIAVDVSQSPNNRPAPTLNQLYRQSAQAFLARTLRGDSILQTTIGHAGMDSLRTINQMAPRSDNEFADKAALKSAVRNTDDWLDTTLAAKKEKTSRILETLGGLQAPVMSAIEAGMSVDMLLCSDMREDSALARFDVQQDRTPLAQDKLLAQLVQRNMLISRPRALPAHAATRAPRVYVVGAGGQAHDAYIDIQNFWQRYFEISRFKLDYYGSELPAFAA